MSLTSSDKNIQRQNPECDISDGLDEWHEQLQLQQTSPKPEDKHEFAVQEMTD